MAERAALGSGLDGEIPNLHLTDRGRNGQTAFLHLSENNQLLILHCDPFSHTLTNYSCGGDLDISTKKKGDAFACNSCSMKCTGMFKSFSQ